MKEVFGMGKILKRMIILVLVFMAALVIYLITAQKTMDRQEAVYTVMEPPLSLWYIWRCLRAKRTDWLRTGRR